MAYRPTPPEQSAAAGYFDSLYDGSQDPWNVATSWYERRKYALTIASLPSESYAHALELGCAFGEMTAMLAERCQYVTAVDCSHSAVERARRERGDLANVDWVEATLPAGMPAVPFDLVVASEVLNYLSAADLDDQMERMIEVLEPDGHLVAVHYIAHHPLAYGGKDVHAHICSRSELEHLVTHEDESFVLDVFSRR
jgi:cyclopropane fatty-acyl-phospholipid synthase-like methyltransferase